MLTVPEAASILGKSPRTIRAHIKSGRLPAVKHGRDWQIDEKDLDLVWGLKRGPKPKA